MKVSEVLTFFWGGLKSDPLYSQGFVDLLKFYPSAQHTHTDIIPLTSHFKWIN